MAKTRAAPVLLASTLRSLLPRSWCTAPSERATTSAHCPSGAAADRGSRREECDPGPYGNTRRVHSVSRNQSPRGRKKPRWTSRVLEVHDSGDGTITVFATGSHGTARKKPDDDKSQQKNRERLQDIKPEPNRALYVRLRLDAQTGQLEGNIETGSLLPFLEASPYFKAIFPGGSPMRLGSYRKGVHSPRRSERRRRCRPGHYRTGRGTQSRLRGKEGHYGPRVLRRDDDGLRGRGSSSE